MMHIPALRWGEPYKSLDVTQVSHFATGEAMAEMSQANGGLVERDVRKAGKARDLLRAVPPAELLAMMARAADLYLNAELPLGDGSQTPDQFVRIQSATTGLPEHMCRANIKKNAFVLQNMPQILDALTRGLDLGILSKGYGTEARGVPVSYQAQAPVLGMVLPNNSPGVHALWLPVVPMQVGLLIKPGSQEPWTPYRIVQAFIQAGVPRQAMGIYPGGHDVGGAVLAHCQRSLMFGGAETVEKYKANPRVSVHGPGFSKVILGNDQADQWAKYVDLMVTSVAINGGRSCINASGVWTPKNARALGEALAERLGPVQPLPPEDPNAALAAFTTPKMAEAINGEIDHLLKTPGATDLTAKFGPRLVRHERFAYLRPCVVLCDSPDHPLANKEYLFPFVAVVQCPQDKLVSAIGPTLVCTALTEDNQLRRALLDAGHVDRLNFGAIPTSQLNWLQPHEGNIVDFLFRARAVQWEGSLTA